jgi:hypothetical protein
MSSSSQIIASNSQIIASKPVSAHLFRPDCRSGLIFGRLIYIIAGADSYESNPIRITSSVDSAEATLVDNLHVCK